MLELDDESTIIKKLLVIEEICSWLPPGLDGRNVCRQEHISLITNGFFNVAIMPYFPAPVYSC